MPDTSSPEANARELARTILARADDAPRFVVGLAGAPASGKSTLASAIAAALPAGSAVVVPMDGFHYDDAVLAARGLASRKGAPETFDFGGFQTLLKRIRAGEPEIAIPVFDRNMELARAGAAIIEPSTRFLVVEGNYLLLDEEPWRGLEALFDLTVFADVPRATLEARMVERWRHHGREAAAARAWIDSNDMPNIDRVIAHRRPADITINNA